MWCGGADEKKIVSANLVSFCSISSTLPWTRNNILKGAMWSVENTMLANVN